MNNPITFNANLNNTSNVANRCRQQMQNGWNGQNSWRNLNATTTGDQIGKKVG